MKKILISLSCIVVFVACSDKKAKNKAIEGKEQVTSSATNESTPEDKAVVEWLIGKEWKAEEDAAPMSILQFFSKDTVGTINGRSAWSLKKGRLIMIADWPLAKLNDTIFTLYVDPTQRTFRYKFVKHL